MKLLLITATAVCLSLGAGQTLAQNFDKGVAAAETGDFDTALAEWLPLAEAGDAKAQYNLGVLFLNGWGVTQNYVAALEMYRLAASQGFPDAQFSLGVLYSKGQGIPKDYEQAFDLYRLAAKQGFVDAQHNLGVSYEFGSGVNQDRVLAHVWYNVASANGSKVSAERRDVLAANMTPEGILLAQAIAHSCLSTSYQECGS